MTNLEKIVRRKTCRPTSASLGYRQLVVALEPGDILSMRQAGRRITYRGALEKVFWVLAKWDAAERKKKKEKERTAEGQE